MIYLITGGVRSGKSSYAEALASYLGQDDVLYLATLSVSDDEMARRIEKHQDQRPSSWKTVEEVTDVDKVIHRAVEKVVLLDCLSGWVSNLVLKYEELGEAELSTVIHRHVDKFVDKLLMTQSDVIIVTNEVGYGVVPPYALGRWFRDALGSANQRVAKSADTVGLMTVGILQTLKGKFPEVEE